ncbi:efflux transporter outer membrane subunit [Sphingorhabdus arenilitoris]|uniref:Efflux transporter outer membrane subunit n=1 Tax=Sphingorhabdus arenilitoris TaxID=1490041 RepID=A0ABV8RFT9_9SPHN
MTRGFKSLLIVASPLLLAGCASMKAPESDPAFNPASVTLPENFALAGDVAAQDRSALENLLPVYDPAFAELRQMGEDNAPTLEAALARINLARAQAARAGANRNPYIGGDGQVTGTRQNPGAFGANLPPGIAIDRYITSFGGNIAASWDPDIFGQLRAGQRAAQIRIDAASADAAAVRQTLVSAIAANVIDWRTVAAREMTLRDDIKTAQEFMRLTKTRSRAGLVPGFDAVQAETLAAQAEAQLAPLLAERARIIGALVTLTGKPASEVIASLDKAAMTGAESAKAVPPAPAATPAAMLRARPDIAAAEARLRAADTDIAVAAKERFPKLNLTGTLGLLAFALGDIFSADAIVGAVGASVAGPLLDFGRIDAEIDASKARAKEAFANYRGTVFAALGDAETAYGQVASAREEVTALKRQYALEADTVYLAGVRYRRGIDDFRGVLNAQRRLNAVAGNLDLAKGRYDRARIALWLALGGS